MQIETPPTEKSYDKAEGERRGIVIANTGDGEGKSKAAFGLALRAHGRGKAVKNYQFMKVPTARFGEHRMFEQIGIPIEGLGDGFSWKSQDLEHSAQLARDGRAKARATILGGEHFPGCAGRNHLSAGLRLAAVARPRSSSWLTPRPK